MSCPSDHKYQSESVMNGSVPLGGGRSVWPAYLFSVFHFLFGSCSVYV